MKKTKSHIAYGTNIHRTIAHGGVLKEGIYARIYYFKGHILRIDIDSSNSSDFILPDSKFKEDMLRDKETTIEITWKDYIWITGVCIANLLFIVRKIILAVYGYDISFMDFGRDHQGKN